MFTKKAKVFVFLYNAAPIFDNFLFRYNITITIMNCYQFRFFCVYDIFCKQLNLINLEKYLHIISDAYPYFL